MDGLECSEIMFSLLERTMRFDAEYYSKEIILLDNFIKTHHGKTISAINGETECSAFYPSITGEYSKDKALVPFLRVNEIQRGLVSLTDGTVYLPQKVLDDNSKTIKIAYPYDIIIAKGSNTLAKVGLVTSQYEHYATCRDVIILHTNNLSINKYYLWAYLHSKFGQSLMWRNVSQTGQPHITLSSIKNMYVPVVSSDLQNVIQKAYELSVELSEQSNKKYDEAEDFLLRQINIDTSSLSTDNISIKSFSESFERTGRLDAEYYQKKYEELIASIQAGAYRKLRDIVDISKSIEPGSDAYYDEGIPFIRISDFSKYGFSTPDKYLEPGSDYDLPELYLKEDEILFSKDGSIGIAYKVEQDTKAITSGALLHLKIRNGIEILPDYLTAVLNSDIVRLQAERDAGGSIINHWKPSEIEEVQIPILANDKQRDISNKVIHSFDLRHKSEYLLEAAKQAVEMAIEQSEEEAITWLNKTVSDIEVSIKYNNRPSGLSRRPVVV